MLWRAARSENNRTGGVLELLSFRTRALAGVELRSARSPPTKVLHRFPSRRRSGSGSDCCRSRATTRGAVERPDDPGANP
jgi:hypothetical protein